MADGNRERIGSVMRRRDLVKTEDRTHHPLHLRLLCPPVAAHAALHGRRRILRTGETGPSAGDEHGASRLADGECGAGVGADVGLFEGGTLRLVPRDEVDDLVVDALQTPFGAVAGGGRPPAVVDGSEATSVCMDDAVTSRCDTRIDAEDLHVSRLGAGPDVPAGYEATASRTPSGMSKFA